MNFASDLIISESSFVRIQKKILQEERDWKCRHLLIHRSISLRFCAFKVGHSRIWISSCTSFLSQMVQIDLLWVILDIWTNFNVKSVSWYSKFYHDHVTSFSCLGQISECFNVDLCLRSFMVLGQDSWAMITIPEKWKVWLCNIFT